MIKKFKEEAVRFKRITAIKKEYNMIIVYVDANGKFRDRNQKRYLKQLSKELELLSR